MTEMDFYIGIATGIAGGYFGGRITQFIEVERYLNAVREFVSQRQITLTGIDSETNKSRKYSIEDILDSSDI